MNTLNFGIIGLGKIAVVLAHALRRVKGASLYAVASRDGKVAGHFAQQHRAVKAYEGYDALLQDPKVDVVYIATPHPMHAEWAIAAANAGKHILCEKPMTLNAFEAEQVLEAVKRNGAFFMEAFMYRAHPQTLKLKQLLHQRVIGDVRRIRAACSFYVPIDRSSRLVSNELGGGGILDLGCYPMSMARMIAGCVYEKPFADPISVRALGAKDEVEGTDLWSTAITEFPGSIVATLCSGVGVTDESNVSIYGTEGIIHVKNPWFCNGKISVGGPGVILPKTYRTWSRKGLYVYEIEELVRCLRNGQKESDCMSWSDSLGNIRALDAWRSEVGVSYKAET